MDSEISVWGMRQDHRLSYLQGCNHGRLPALHASGGLGFHHSTSAGISDHSTPPWCRVGLSRHLASTNHISPQSKPTATSELLPTPALRNHHDITAYSNHDQHSRLSCCVATNKYLAPSQIDRLATRQHQNCSTLHVKDCQTMIPTKPTSSTKHAKGFQNMIPKQTATTPAQNIKPYPFPTTIHNHDNQPNQLLNHHH